MCLCVCFSKRTRHSRLSRTRAHARTHERTNAHSPQELIPKYFKPTEVSVVTGGVEQTTELLAQK